MRYMYWLPVGPTPLGEDYRHPLRCTAQRQKGHAPYTPMRAQTPSVMTRAHAICANPRKFRVCPKVGCVQSGITPKTPSVMTRAYGLAQITVNSGYAQNAVTRLKGLHTPNLTLAHMHPTPLQGGPAVSGTN